MVLPFGEAPDHLPNTLLQYFDQLLCIDPVRGDPIHTLLIHCITSTITTVPSYMSQQSPHGMAPILISSFVGCCSSILLTPLETIKTIIQLRNEGIKQKVVFTPLIIVKETFQKEGFKGLRSYYTALDATVLDATITCGVRIGLFRYVKESQKTFFDKDLTFGEKLVTAVASGGLAAILTNPIDMISLQFSARQDVPKWKRVKYTNIFNQILTHTKEYGFFDLYKGLPINILRSAMFNTSQLVCYHSIKQSLQQRYHNIFVTKLISSVSSGLVMCVTCLPFDNLNTKMLTMTKTEHGKSEYTGTWDCLVKSFRKEGVMGLWTGWRVFYMTMGTYSMATVVAEDVLWDWYRNKIQH